MGKPFRFGTFFAARGIILRLTADTCLPRDVTSILIYFPSRITFQEAL